MYPAKQSTALTVPVFAHDVNGDAVTGLSDGSFTKRISKNGGAFGAMTVTITELENGWYSIPLGTGHTDTLGVLSITFTNAGAKQINIQLRVHVRLPDDLTFPLTSGRATDVTATGAVGIDWANVENQGTAVDLSGTDFQLVDTCTTNTDMVGTDSALLAASAPTNFGDMAITVTTGLVDLNDKTGFSLASTGLDAITQAATGMVEIAKAVWDRVLTGATHNISNSAGRRLRGIQEFQGYDNGAIWIDTVDGTAGTVNFENGTVENPVDNIADANTLAASLNIERFELAPGSSITLGAAQNNQQFNGRNWTLALNGQDIAGSIFLGATVSGVAAGIGTMQIFEKCLIGVTSHIKGTHLLESGLSGTQTIVEAGDFFTDRCHSAIAGTATPVWDFGGALAASNLSFRNYSGGIEIQNMGAGAGSYTMSLEGRGQLIINANCSATSSVAIRGLFTVTDNAGGAVTLSDAARFDTAQDLTVGTVSTAAISSTSFGAGAVDAAAIATDAIGSSELATSAVNEIVDQVWNEARIDHTTQGSYGETMDTVVSGNAITGTLSTTLMTTDLTEITDDHYNGRTIIWTSGVLIDQATNITDYDGGTKMLTFTAVTEAPSNTDDFIIV